MDFNKKPLVKNAADPDQVKEAEGKVKRGRELELEDMRFILGTAQGKRFVWRYLSECGVFKTSWDPSAKIHFNEGKRNIGLKIIADITEAKPLALVEMMTEAEKESKNV